MPAQISFSTAPKGRPSTVSFAGENIGNSQGDHVTAYALLVQLLLRSLPSIVKYEELPVRLATMLSYAFGTEADANKFCGKVSEAIKQAGIISDSQRREFLGQNKSRADLEALNGILKTHQIERYFKLTCYIGDLYLRMVNAEIGAVIHNEKSTGGKGESVPIKLLEELDAEATADDVERVLLKEVGNLRGSSESSVRRIENLTSLLSNIRDKRSKSKPTKLLTGAGDKERLETLTQACRDIGHAMTVLVDLPIFQQFQYCLETSSLSPVLGRQKVYKNYLAAVVKRHFRVAGGAFSSALSRITSDCDDAQQDEYYNIIIDSFFEYLIQNKKLDHDLLISIKLSNSYVTDRGPDALTKKVAFIDSLKNILRDRVRQF